MYIAGRIIPPIFEKLDSVKDRAIALKNPINWHILEKQTPLLQRFVDSYRHQSKNKSEF